LGKALPGANTSNLIACAPRDWNRPGIISGAVETDPSAARKRFFLKKEAKTFPYWCARCGSLNTMRTKVFWFFFSKKNCLLFSSDEARIWVNHKGGW
jgi:hypothetical protein